MLMHRKSCLIPIIKPTLIAFSESSLAFFSRSELPIFVIFRVSFGRMSAGIVLLRDKVEAESMSSEKKVQKWKKMSQDITKPSKD